VPGRVGNKENPIYDRGDRYQVERDSGCQWCTDKTEIDRFGTPHKKVVENHVDGRNDEDDLGWDRKEALRLEVSTARRETNGNIFEIYGSEAMGWQKEMSVYSETQALRLVYYQKSSDDDT